MNMGDLLSSLALFALLFDPPLQLLFLKTTIEEDEQFDVTAKAGLGQLGQLGQVAEHVLPLVAAPLVSVEAAIKSVQAVIGIHQQVHQHR